MIPSTHFYTFEQISSSSGFTVEQLIKQLQKFPKNHKVHLVNKRCSQELIREIWVNGIGHKEHLILGAGK